MGFWHWLSQNRLGSVEVGSLFVATIALCVDAWARWSDAKAHKRDAEAHELNAKAHQQTNLLTITRSHRELWMEFVHTPELKRVRDANADLETTPVTEAEHVFVTLVIAHTNTVFHGTDRDLVIEYEGMGRDIAEFFSLPIPSAVWRKLKPLQNHDFVEFMEASLN